MVAMLMKGWGCECVLPNTMNLAVLLLERDVDAFHMIMVDSIGAVFNQVSGGVRAGTAVCYMGLVSYLNWLELGALSDEIIIMICHCWWIYP